MDESTSLPRTNAGSRITRAAYLAVKKLHWSLHLNESHRSDARRQHLFDIVPVDPVPATPLHCSSRSDVQLMHGHISIAHDLWMGWGATVNRIDHETLRVFTDGSFDSFDTPSSSSWSVVIGDRWLYDNFQSVPSECLMQLADVGGATLIGARITCTQGVYPAELQAIARVLAMLPLSLRLEIHTDSQASIAAIESYSTELNERRRMRMAARTILQLIHNLITRREKAGGRVQLTHVRAHTAGSDILSIGNRIADFQANRSRLAAPSSRTYPLGLAQLPLHLCEHHMYIRSSDGRVVINDVRRTSSALTHTRGLAVWHQHGDTGIFASEGTIELGRVVMNSGSATQQATFVHIATNSIHYYWPRLGPDPHDSVLTQVPCTAECTASDTNYLTLEHLAHCRSRISRRCHQQLRDELIQHLTCFDACHAWLAAHSRDSLFPLLSNLFPLPGSVTVEEFLVHPARCLIGAYTRSECTKAGKTLGFNELSEGRSALDQLRLLCVTHIGQFYTGLKNLPP